MAADITIELDSELTAEDYLVVGVSACYQLEDSDLQPVKVLEPIPSAYLESLFQGVPTSYERILGTTVGTALSQEIPADILGSEDVRICRNFGDRVTAAARTYKARPEATALVAVGTTRTDINFSTEKKRVLNQQNIVTKEDNIRQHKYTHQTL